MRQYEIWWARLPEPIGRRPVLLLTRTPALHYLNKVIVVEITTRIREIPVELVLGRPEGLRRRSVANFDNTHVIAKATLEKRIGALTRSRVREAKACLGWALDWPELKAPEA